MNSYDTSSGGVNYTPFKHTSDEIKWVGEPVPCLNVCRGASITTLEKAILDKLCTLVGEVDMSNVTIPSCFVDAWLNKDKTILLLFEFLLTTACQQAQTIATLPTTNDPVITLDYKCCADNPCFNSVEVKISEHLQQILDCICALNTRVVDLEVYVQTLANLQLFNALNSQINCLKGAILAWNLQPANTDNQINLNEC